MGAVVMWDYARTIPEVYYDMFAVFTGWSYQARDDGLPVTPLRWMYDPLWMDGMRRRDWL